MKNSDQHFSKESINQAVNQVVRGYDDLPTLSITDAELGKLSSQVEFALNQKSPDRTFALGA